MSVLTPELREALARVGTSILIGVLDRRACTRCASMTSIRTGQPRMAGNGCTKLFIPSREDKDGPASTNRSTVQPQTTEACRGGEA